MIIFDNEIWEHRQRLMLNRNVMFGEHACKNCKHNFSSSPRRPCANCDHYDKWEGDEMSLCDSNDWDNDTDDFYNKRIPVKRGNLTETLLQERGKNYGDFKDTALITQQCEEVFKTCASNYDKLLPIQREALHMILQKLARAANGDCSYADSWVDISGYAQLVVDYLQET
jgi:hypothetical protein